MCEFIDVRSVFICINPVGKVKGMSYSFSGPDVLMSTVVTVLGPVKTVIKT